MARKTGIEWTDATWNPVVGCTKVSPGCKHCYAKLIHDMRHKAYLEGKKVAPQYAVPFEKVQLKAERLTRPLSWQEPSLIFVNSVSDLFHEDVPFWFIDQVFAIMALARRHTFQILTKRPDRMLEWSQRNSTGGHIFHLAQQIDPAGRGAQSGQWPLPNVWLGVSVENQRAADERIPLLLQVAAAVRWLSMEPLLGPVDLSIYIEEEGYIDDKYVRPIDWVVVGGESGSKKQSPRPMHPAWAQSIRDQCVAHDVPFLFKQWGDYANETVDGVSPVLAELKPNQCVAAGDGETNHVRFTRVGKKRAGRVLDGRLWNQMPERAAA